MKGKLQGEAVSVNYAHTVREEGELLKQSLEIT